MAVDLFLPEFPSSEGIQTIVYVHGFKGFKDWAFVPHLHDFLVTENTAVVTFNFTHNGVDRRDFDDLQRFADNTVTQELRDMESIALWLVNEACQEYNLHPEKVSWLGHSRGGANVILFASKFPDYIDKIVTWAAIDSYETLFKSIDKNEWKSKGTVQILNTRTNQEMPLNYIIWQDLELHSKEYNILLAAGSLTKPWLIIHGNSDMVVPIAAARNLYEACDHSTKIEIDGQDHTFGCKHPMKDLSEAPHDFWFILDNTLEFITEELEDSDIQI